MRGLAFVRRHPAFSYFLLTYTISWGGALLAIGGGGGMAGTTPGSDPRFVYALLAMLAGPSLSGLLLTGLVQGRGGFRDLKARLLTWRVPLRWYAVALLMAPLLMIATLLVLSTISPAFVPGLFIAEDPTTILLAGVGVGLSAGIFEELGWTGFAVPILRTRHGLIGTGLLVGIPWGAWHLLPNFWSASAAAGDLSFPLYAASSVAGAVVGYLPAFRVLMVWVHDRTRSVLVAMLMHVSFTGSLLILNPVGLAGAPLAIYSFVLAAAIWIVVVGYAGFAARRPVIRSIVMR
jgi:CAAX protease family protein